MSAAMNPDSFRNGKKERLFSARPKDSKKEIQGKAPSLAILSQEANDKIFSTVTTLNKVG